MLLICVPIRTGFVKLLTSGKKRNLIILKRELDIAKLWECEGHFIGGIQKSGPKVDNH